MEEERETCQGKDRGLSKLGRGKGKNDGRHQIAQNIAWGLLTALSHFCFKMVFWLTFDLINEYKNLHGISSGYKQMFFLHMIHH